MAIRVGCCGFAVSGGMRSYHGLFDLVEVQSTFYNIPRLETIDKWRLEAPISFEFVPKAFQGITHPITSPTWRRFRGKLQGKGSKNDRYGFLRPTEEVIDCWKTMVEICSRLESKAMLVQTPPNFSCSPSSILDLEQLLTTVNRKGIVICWEPRGDWNDNPDKIENICSRMDLVHVVDIMRREPLSHHEINYIRLHGLNPKEFDYRYSYSDRELIVLRGKVLDIEQKSKRVYVLFNNTGMAHDAERFQETIQRAV